MGIGIANVGQQVDHDRKPQVSAQMSVMRDVARPNYTANESGWSALRA